MPEDMAFILSKSGVDMLRDGKVMSAVRTDGQTDDFSSLYSRYRIVITQQWKWEMMPKSQDLLGTISLVFHKNIQSIR